MIRKWILFLCCLFCISGFLNGKDILEMNYLPSAALSGMGGTHPTFNNGIQTMFSNPAGFQQGSAEFSLSELTIALQGPIFDITSIIMKTVSGSTTDPLEIINDPLVLDLVNRLHAAVGLAGPIYFGYAGNGLGFGLFNYTDVEFKNAGNLTISAKLAEQLFLSGGYSFRIALNAEKGHFIDLGLLLKGSVRLEADIKRSLFELALILSSGEYTFLLNEPFFTKFGIGADIGLLYSYQNILSFGVTAKNIYTSVFQQKYDGLNEFTARGESENSSYIIPMKLNAGIRFSPGIPLLGGLISDLALYLDYNDILDFVLAPQSAVNPILHIALGTEIEILEIFTVRGGFSEGLFSAGFGIDLTYFRIQASMFGTELGSEPGMNPAYNMQVGFEFRL